MLISLTANQLRALAGQPALILAEILDAAPRGDDQAVEIRCPTSGRSAYGKALRALLDAGIVTVADPGSWTRARYTVQISDQTDARWFGTEGADAVRRWPSLYPGIWTQLRGERPDLDMPTFRRRFRHGLLDALARAPIPPNIMTWMITALTIELKPPPTPAPGQAPANQPPHQAIQQLEDVAPGYLDRCHHRFALKPHRNQQA